METYLLGLLEHLKCGYYSDVTVLGQLLGRKEMAWSHNFGTLCLYQAWDLVTSWEACLKVQGLLTLPDPPANNCSNMFSSFQEHYTESDRSQHSWASPRSSRDPWEMEAQTGRTEWLNELDLKELAKDCRGPQRIPRWRETITTTKPEREARKSESIFLTHTWAMGWCRGLAF